MRRIVVGFVTLFLLTGTLGGVAGGPLGGDPSASGDSGAVTESTWQMENFTDTSFEITVFENGDGRWAIRQIRPLETDTEVEDFETFAQRFETEQTDTFQTFRERANRLTESGSSATGREMTAEAFEREAFVDERGQRTGVIVMSFRWTNIAVTDQDSDRVVLADIFAGGWSILDSQRVVVQPGERLRFAASPAPQPDSGLESVTLAEATSITYEGPAEFTDRRPRVAFEPDDESGSDGTSDGGTSDDGTADGQTEDSGTSDDSQTDDGAGDSAGDGETANGSGTDMVMMAVAAVLLVGIGGGVTWYAATRTRTETTETAPLSQPRSETSEPAAETVDPELVADEDRVLQLLEQNGGRMKQVDIVEETEWSKSKVSMLLSEMEEEELISKLRVGRENIISLAGEEPDAAGSPFEE
ncbi:helix-turn-helix transcriptional regulator [Halovenus marina]|uniref:helix-turn-helix transcriptional regulator n=1 Tax=Halovenus marina TaxID=3396621 RepID=UPI003F56AC05